MRFTKQLVHFLQKRNTSFVVFERVQFQRLVELLAEFAGLFRVSKFEMAHCNYSQVAWMRAREVDLLGR